MFRFACPHCQTPLQADDDKIGQKAICARCKKAFAVPGPPKASIAPNQPNTPTALTAADVEPSQPASKPRSRTTPGLESGCLLALGGFGLIVGLIITLRYWGMDTTVLTADYHAVHNEGLMNDRLVGVIVGIGWTLASLLILGAARPRRIK
jgi:predicted Zn finger-like uncharacterized protein